MPRPELAGVGCRAAAPALRPVRQRPRPRPLVAPPVQVKENRVAIETAPPPMPEQRAAGPRVPITLRLGVGAEAASGSDRSRAQPDRATKGRIKIDRLEAWYGSFRAFREVTLPIGPPTLTAFIRPPGVRKGTVLRTLHPEHQAR